MTNRGFTTAERLHHTILTNRSASAEPVCPLCDGATRVKPINGELRRICRAACGWPGKSLTAETEAARTALIERGEGHLIGRRA